jgi:hypothetical protein
MSGTRVRKRSGVDAGVAAVKRYSAVVEDLIKDAKVKQRFGGSRSLRREIEEWKRFAETNFDRSALERTDPVVIASREGSD